MNGYILGGSGSGEPTASSRGDWSRVAVRIAGGMRFERSNDFKFDSDEVVFRAVMRFDSRLVNTDAVRYFVNASS
jgi:HK97 family phage major capsid protein